MKEILNDNLVELFEPIIKKYVYEELPINIFVSNKYGYILWGNSRVIDTLKETKETFIGKHLSAWGEENWNNCKKVIETGQEHTEEEIGIDNRIYLTTRKPFKDGCDIAGVIGISSDITDKRKAEIIATQILDNMQYNLRTPLEGIIGCAQLIQLEADPKKQIEYASNIISSSKALCNFHNKVLEAIQVTRGGTSLVKNKFDLRKEMELVIDINSSSATEKNIALTLNYDETIFPYLIGDPTKVKYIALELITNALKFTETGEVALIVKLMRINAKESIIKISVSDTGIGIPKDKQNDIFLRFNRLSPSFKGAGLGLSIIKQFVDDLGGEISVNSKEGTGTTLDCLIPFRNPLIMNSSGIHESVSLPLCYLE